MKKITPISASITLACLLAQGCGPTGAEPYEPNWRYPLRSDPIVLKLPTTHPSQRHDPGLLDESLRELPNSGGTILDPETLSEEVRAKLTRVLEDHFGTPAQPKIEGIDGNSKLAFHLEPEDLKRAAGVYKISCSNCHGMSGNGRGPAGEWTDPHPRDIRNGNFKAARGASAKQGRPSVSDLNRVLQHGVPGSTMVPRALAEEDRRILIGYTIFLSIRGEVEQELMKGIADEDEPITDLDAAAKERIQSTIKKWTAANAEGPSVPQLDWTETPERLRNGAKLFETSGCASCHEQYGKTKTYRYDVWGIPVRVRNLTEPERLWAQEPDDVFRQLKLGIAAANMPGSTLNETELRDLVLLTRALPYPKRLPADLVK